MSGPDGDGCCPSGCNAANDSDCAVVCGNGTHRGPARPATRWPRAPAPARRRAAGCASWSTAAPAPPSASTPACRPPASRATAAARVACNSTNDTDCPALCGNSVVEAGRDLRSHRQLHGPGARLRERRRHHPHAAWAIPASCQFTCMETTRTCGPADGACPPGCGPTQDRDCPGCGNGVMEPSETCDPVAVCLERQRTCISDQSTIRTPGGDPAACTFTCMRDAPPLRPGRWQLPRRLHARPATPTAPAAATACWIPGETCDPVSVCEQRAPGLRQRRQHHPHARWAIPTPAASPARRRPGRAARPTASARPTAAPPRTGTARAAATAASNRARPATRAGPRTSGPASATSTPSARPMGSAEACTFACTRHAPALPERRQLLPQHVHAGNRHRLSARARRHVRGRRCPRAAPAAASTGAAACRPAPSASPARVRAAPASPSPPDSRTTYRPAPA